MSGTRKKDKPGSSTSDVLSGFKAPRGTSSGGDLASSGGYDNAADENDLAADMFATSAASPRDDTAATNSSQDAAKKAETVEEVQQSIVAHVEETEKTRDTSNMLPRDAQFFVNIDCEEFAKKTGRVLERFVRFCPLNDDETEYVMDQLTDFVAAVRAVHVEMAELAKLQRQVGEDADPAIDAYLSEPRCMQLMLNFNEAHWTALHFVVTPDSMDVITLDAYQFQDSFEDEMKTLVGVMPLESIHVVYGEHEKDNLQKYFTCYLMAQHALNVMAMDNRFLEKVKMRESIAVACVGDYEKDIPKKKGEKKHFKVVNHIQMPLQIVVVSELVSRSLKSAGELNTYNAERDLFLIAVMRNAKRFEGCTSYRDVTDQTRPAPFVRKDSKDAAKMRNRLLVDGNLVGLSAEAKKKVKFVKLSQLEYTAKAPAKYDEYRRLAFQARKQHRAKVRWARDIMESEAPSPIMQAKAEHFLKVVDACEQLQSLRFGYDRVAYDATNVVENAKADVAFLLPSHGEKEACAVAAYLIVEMIKRCEMSDVQDVKTWAVSPDVAKLKKDMLAVNADGKTNRLDFDKDPNLKKYLDDIADEMYGKLGNIRHAGNSPGVVRRNMQAVITEISTVYEENAAAPFAMRRAAFDVSRFDDVIEKLAKCAGDSKLDSPFIKLIREFDANPEISRQAQLQLLVEKIKNNEPVGKLQPGLKAELERLPEIKMGNEQRQLACFERFADSWDKSLHRSRKKKRVPVKKEEEGLQTQLGPPTTLKK